jgi:hypothetical protein
MDSNMQLNTSGVLIIEIRILMDPVSDILKKTFAGGNGIWFGFRLTYYPKKTFKLQPVF